MPHTFPGSFPFSRKLVSSDAAPSSFAINPGGHPGEVKEINERWRFQPTPTSKNTHPKWGSNLPQVYGVNIPKHYLSCHHLVHVLFVCCFFVVAWFSLFRGVVAKNLQFSEATLE